MEQPVRLALIGCGGWMRYAHLPVLQKIENLEVVAGCDPSREALEQTAAAWGKPFEFFSSHKKMIKQTTPDAVLIVSPHDRHVSQTRFALEQGVHALVEKPFTIRSRDARALLALAKKKKRIVHVSYQRHHSPVYVHARNLMRDGAIGKVKALVAQITQNWGMKKNDSWRQDPKQSGGGMFIDTGSHLVASSLFVSGLKVRSVAAHTDNCGLDVDILAALSIRFDGGALGTLATVGQVKNHSEYFALHGTEGTLEIRHYNWKVEQFLLNGQQVEVPATLEGEHPCQAFIRWISRGEKYEPPLYAIEVARITEAAYASAKKAKHIVIKR